MMRASSISFLVAFGAVSLLSACTWRGEGDADRPQGMIRGARSGLTAASEVAEAPRSPPRSSAAVRGVEANARIGREDDTSTTAVPPDREPQDDSALLERLRFLTTVEIPVLLNRAPNRDAALEAFVEEASDTLAAAERREADLRTRMDELEEEIDALQERRDDLEGEVTSVLSSDPSSNTLSSLTEELTATQRSLAESQTLLSVSEQLSEEYSSRLPILGERLQAVLINRDALILGIQVTDLPGAEDLGVLQRRE